MLLRLLPSVQILNQGTVADMTAKTVLRAPYIDHLHLLTLRHRVTCHWEHPVLSHLQWSSLVCEHELNTGIPIINMLW